MRTILSICLLILLLVTACTPAPTPVTATAAPTAETASESLTAINLGASYIPSVQFTPYYVAHDKGFFADEGLDVQLEYGYENDFVALTGQGKFQFALASGDQVILARAQGLPIVYVMKWYQRYPVGVMSLADSGIRTPKDLEGHKVGISGMFGADLAGWNALVYANQLDQERIDLESIGFTKAEALSQGTVDATVCYVNNEPVQLRQSGYDVNLMEVSDYVDMVSNGIITNETVMRDDPELIRRLVRGFLRGLEYSLDNPDEAFDIARRAVPEITDENAAVHRAVLEASMGLWRSDQPGYSSPQAWQATLEMMLATGLVDADLSADSMYSNDFLPE
jgi:NitT/TauT family transport system substrate-binding protein